MIRLTEREQMVWDKRNAGLTFKQIAKDLGLCPATVSFAFRKARRKIEYEKERLKPTELEVYKRALEIANHNDLSWCNYCIIKARKELEDERK